MLLNAWLLVKILLNFRFILNWFVNSNMEVDPRKLLCINSILLLATTR